MGDIGKKINDFFSGLMPKDDEPAAPPAGWLKRQAFGTVHPLSTPSSGQPPSAAQPRQCVLCRRSRRSQRVRPASGSLRQPSTAPHPDDRPAAPAEDAPEGEPAPAEEA